MAPKDPRRLAGKFGIDSGPVPLGRWRGLERPPRQVTGTLRDRDSDAPPRKRPKE
jgi:hypothetical protein